MVDRIDSRVYCLTCNQLTSRDKADVVFKTGYYQTIFPLALCSSCESAGVRETAGASDRFEAAEMETHDRL